MLAFKVQGGAEFGFVAAFTEHDFANMSFFAPNREDILFHLSLRKSAGKAVVNLCKDTVWRDEIMHDVSLAASGNTVLIRFDDTRVSVVLNEDEICVYDGDFPNLDSIEFVNFSGGLVASSLLIAGPGNVAHAGKGQLQMSGFMDVEGWAVDPGAPRQEIAVNVAGLAEAITTIPVAHPEIAQAHGLSDPNVGVLASLPGRIWEAADPETGNVQVVIRVNGLQCADPVTLTRGDAVARIEDVLQSPIDPAFPFDGILALEHVRYGDFLPDLSEACRRSVAEAAAQFGLQDFLSGQATTQPPALTSDAKSLIRVRTRFAHAVNTKTDGARHIDILRDVLSGTPLELPQLSELMLLLADEFCAVDQFEDLFDFGAKAGLTWFNVGKGVWYNSVITPFLYMENRIGDLNRAFQKLAVDARGWLATSAMGWTICKMFSENWVLAHEKRVEDTAYAFIAAIEHRHKNHWAQTSSEALIDATLCMMRLMPRLPEAFEETATAFAMRVFGLSRRFWEGYRQSSGSILSERLVYGQTCFETITALAAGANPARVDVEAAFDFFGAFNPDEAVRYRRELLGSGVGLIDSDDAQSETRLLAARYKHDTLLRHYAFPGQSEVPSPQVARHLRMGMRDKYTEIPKGPNVRLQGDVIAHITDLLDQMAATGNAAQVADWQNRLERIFDRLAVLGSARNNFFGLGVGISLLDCLVQLGVDDAATLVVSWIDEVRGDIPTENQTGLFSQPAIFSALERLARGPQSELSQTALGMFPNFTLPGGTAINPKALQRTWPGVSHVTPLYDTIVTVVSCQSNLDTCIQPMRDGWLAQLKNRGIPYIVMVGGGDGQRVDDVVYLDTSDDFEGLPQKILAAAEWVQKNTPFSHMFKIDDDCFVDVDEMFKTLTHRKFDYYGRTLSRAVGQTDRVWHFAKSTSERGRKELDKSPEPSQYADGGAGYFLSRRAIRALVQSGKTVAGQRLIKSSFAEDKMVGDLLRSKQIKLFNEDYYVSIRRRTHSTATPVPLWENGFHPGPASIVKQVHLDTPAHQGDAMARKDQPGLWPRKLWPTFQPVKLGFNSNALELISPEAKLEALNAAPVAAVSCMRNEMFMLPHYLAHYRALGVKAFLIADNCSDDGTLDYLLEQPDVVTFSADTEYKKSENGVAWHLTLLANLRVGRWSLVVDADELLVYPNWAQTSLEDLLSGEAFKGADAARIFMLDMYPQGPLSAADFTSGGPFAEAGFADRTPFLRETTGRGPYCNSATVTSALRHRLLPWSRPDLFVSQKYSLLKYQPWMRPSAGFHYVGDIKPSTTELIFAHFKYNAQFHQKAVNEAARKQFYNNAEEYQKYLALMSEGREVIYDADVSVPWMDADAVKRIMSGSKAAV